MSESDETGEKTAVIHGDQITLAKELQKAKEQPPCFIIIRGSPPGHRFFLTQEEMTIGRDPSAELSLSDQSISRKHAKVIQKGGEVWLADLGSINGTYVNNKKLESKQTVKLEKEDMVKLGNSILKFLPAGELEIIFYGNLGDAANLDGLTNIYNKRFLMEALEAEFKRAKALHADFSLIYFDLDHFKKVNDTYGHDAGDFVLKEVCALIKGLYVRPKDVFARYGGEEFVILLGNTTLDEAAATAEKIRASIESHIFNYEGKRLPVTASLGVAELTAEVESSATLLKSADKALYAAKNGGRNQVVKAGG